MPTQGFGNPGRDQSPVPQAELGPSMPASLCPLSRFGCAQTLKGQSCSMDGMAKQQQTLFFEVPSCLTPHVPTQPGDAAAPPQSRCCLQQHLLSHRISRGPETRPARPGALAVRNAPKPAGSQALQQHHGSVHALTGPKAAWSFLGILLGLKGGGGMLFIVKRHEGVPTVLNNTLMFH